MADKAGAARAAPLVARFTKLAEADVATPYSHLHDGDGTVSLRYLRFDNTPAPANFVVYDMPPGSSEGVHTHQLGDAMLESYDEYYYIVEGQGEMDIDGEIVPVQADHHVHTPPGVAGNQNALVGCVISFTSSIGEPTISVLREEALHSNLCLDPIYRRTMWTAKRCCGPSPGSAAVRKPKSF